MTTVADLLDDTMHSRLDYPLYENLADQTLLDVRIFLRGIAKLAVGDALYNANGDLETQLKGLMDD